MRLAETLETVQNRPPNVGEAWETYPSPRIIPENEIEQDALAQIWEYQRIPQWTLNDLGKSFNVPFDTAEFNPLLTWQKDGFAKSSLILSKEKFDAFKLLEDNDDAQTVHLDLLVYWLWQEDLTRHNRVKAYWSIGSTRYTTPQTNSVEHGIVLAMRDD